MKTTKNTSWHLEFSSSEIEELVKLLKTDPPTNSNVGMLLGAVCPANPKLTLSYHVGAVLDYVQNGTPDTADIRRKIRIALG